MAQPLTEIFLVLSALATLVGIVLLTLLISIRSSGSDFGDDPNRVDESTPDVESAGVRQGPCWDLPDIRRRMSDHG